MENKEQLNPEEQNLNQASGQSESEPAEKKQQPSDNTTQTSESQDKEDTSLESADDNLQNNPQETVADQSGQAEVSDQEAEPEASQPELVPEAKQEEVKKISEAKEKKAEEETPADNEDISEEQSSPAEQVSTTILDVVENIAKDKEQESEKPIEAKPEEASAKDTDEDLAALYLGFSKKELVEAAEALVENEDVNHIRKHIGFLKAAFRKVVKEENLANYEKSLNEGDEKIEAEPGEAPVDELTVRFDTAFNIYKEKKAVHDQMQEKSKQDNLAAKEAILEDLRQLIESEEELKKTYDQFHELQERWRQVGQVPQNAKSTLWNNYHFLVEKFFDKVKINKELKDLDLKKNLEAKTELCEKAEELLLEPSITKSFQRLQKLHEAWKEIGPVPNDKKDEIWDRFKAATDKLNKRRQEHYDLLRDEQNQNYSAKLLLCEKAEQLAAHTPDTPRKWQELTNQINELFSAWKTIGFAPKKVNNEVWTRFRSAMDNFFRNKKEFFSKYKDQQTENYNQKLNLCMQAEVLKESEDWRATTDELISLQKEWKKIGPVPSKYSDKIWKRFRAACDEFFEKKAKYFSNIGEKQDDNLKNKLELIEKVRKYPYSENNNENLEVLKGFQRQWMEIGHVPIKQKDKVQAEFRKAIDEQFEKLRLNKKVKNTLSFHSKIENLKNSPNAENIIYKERNFLVNKITGLQNDIKLWENNIGFFASSKKADVLKAEFEEKIENARQEIAVMKEKLKILRDA